MGWNGRMGERRREGQQGRRTDRQRSQLQVCSVQGSQLFALVDRGASFV
jgi:hypothetical protein